MCKGHIYVYIILSLTVCVYSNNEVISHGLGLPQLVGVAVMYHVIAVKEKHMKEEYDYSQKLPCSQVQCIEG